MENLKSFGGWLFRALWPLLIIIIQLIVIQFVYTWFTGYTPDIWEWMVVVGILILLEAKRINNNLSENNDTAQNIIDNFTNR